MKYAWTTKITMVCNVGCQLDCRKVKLRRVILQAMYDTDDNKLQRSALSSRKTQDPRTMSSLERGLASLRRNGEGQRTLGPPVIRRSFHTVKPGPGNLLPFKIQHQPILIPMRTSFHYEYLVSGVDKPE